MEWEANESVSVDGVLVTCILGSVISLLLGMLIAVASTGPIALSLFPYPSLYWPFPVIGFVIGG